MIDPGKMRTALEALFKAGWIKEPSKVKTENDTNAHVALTLTKEGAERFSALFILLRELDQSCECGRLDDSEMGYIWSWARIYTPKQPEPIWPSEPPRIGSKGDRQ